MPVSIDAKKVTSLTVFQAWTSSLYLLGVGHRYLLDHIALEEGSSTGDNSVHDHCPVEKEADIELRDAYKFYKVVHRKIHFFCHSRQQYQLT